MGQVCVVAQRAAEQDWEEVNMGAPALNPRLCPFLTLPGSHWPSLALHGLPGLPWHHLWSNKLSLPKKPSKGQGEGEDGRWVSSLEAYMMALLLVTCWGCFLDPGPAVGMERAKRPDSGWEEELEEKQERGGLRGAPQTPAAQIRGGQNRQAGRLPGGRVLCPHSGA